MIGLSFGAELAAAGFDGLPFNWSKDGLGDLSALSQEQRDGVLAVFAAHVPDAVQLEQVNAERDRRIFGGFTFAGRRFQSRLEDQKRINGAGTLALAAIVGGAQAGDYRWHGGETDFAWIAEDNSLVLMDAQTVLAFGQACARHETLHVFAARALKDLPEIPADYRDAKYWPVQKIEEVQQ